MVDIKNYICVVPFSSIELHQNVAFLCCASWLKKSIPYNNSLKESWESDEAQEIRRSVIDGSFKYCDKSHCPHLNQLTKLGVAGEINNLYYKDNIPNEYKKQIDSFVKGEKFNPSIIQFSFDRSCNLKCPSCRIDVIIESIKGIEKVKKTIEEIKSEYGKTTKVLYITGTGDPFVSVGFRDFLKTFKSDEWPSLEKIHLHTNATKWNKNMWDSMSNIHKYVKSCEISIDAATKDTYENKTRINGNWDELISNLNFINTIPTLKKIKTSFVVQQKNYKEMKLFYELMTSIFGNKVNVYYGKITNWGTFSEDQYVNQKIWDSSHPEYEDFLKEINSFLPAKQVWNNLQEIVNPKKGII